MGAESKAAAGAGFRPAPGITLYSGHLSRALQEELSRTVSALLAGAPLYTPAMPRSGRPMSVRMTNFGPLGWVTDKQGGYRYQPHHPVTGGPWPAIPEILLDLWREVAGYPAPPEACLVNFYDENARLGLHRDEDEQDYAAPVVSVSLGDDCLFRIGGTARSDPQRSLRLRSGDVLVFGGPARLAYHGVTRVYPGTSTLLPGSGRINLTLRRVTPHG